MISKIPIDTDKKIIERYEKRADFTVFFPHSFKVFLIHNLILHVKSAIISKYYDKRSIW